MSYYIEREAALEAAKKSNLYFDLKPIINSIPAADVPPALWTDEPISGTEFMTHNQGQSGFEIHFRTDDKAKYEAVQDECRRQIGHAKPAADVRPVVLCRDCEYCRKVDEFEYWCDGFCSPARLVRKDDFCSHGKAKE